jgi:hypothetical protein
MTQAESSTQHSHYSAHASWDRRGPGAQPSDTDGRQGLGAEQLFGAP